MVLARVGLEHRAGECARLLSGGERQRLALARAWAMQPRLLLLDEPTASLDPSATEQVENIIRGLKERGVPMILISHNLRQVFDLVDRIVVFRRGRIVASLTWKATASSRTRALPSSWIQSRIRRRRGSDSRPVTGS